MKRRKKGDGEHHGAGLDRWMVSWADFLTLLFAFFVVMYATALTEQGRVDIIADSILRALKMQTPSIVTPIRLSAPPPSIPYKAPVEMPVVPESLFPELGFMPKEPQPGSPEGITEAVMRELEGALAPLIEQGLVEVRRSEYWVEVELKDKVLFPTAKATLDQDAQQLLAHIAQIFAPFPYPIRVEGHTDNVPIHREPYPSNWELSAARAASVVRLFQGKGIDPKRLEVVGYGEYHPVAYNSTPEGRAKNRRIAIVMVNGPDLREIEMLRRRAEAQRLEGENARTHPSAP
jgi:chemotaxis protein MotB